MNRGPAPAVDPTGGVAVAASLAPIVLPDVDGARHRLGDHWAKRPAVVEFLRHYG